MKKRYFSKPAADLDLGEAAMMAGLVQSPSRYDPINDIQEATKRRDTVLQRMADVKDISQAEADAAMAKPIKLKVKTPRNGCITAVDGAGFFCDYVRKTILNDPVFGKTSEERQKLWNLGGLTIRTTLDPRAQAAANEAAIAKINKDDPVAASVVQVQPKTGRILSMGQSRPYGLDQKQHQTTLNLAVGSKMGGNNVRLPGRLDLQADHGGGRPGEGHQPGDQLQRPGADQHRRERVHPLRRQALRLRELGGEQRDQVGEGRLRHDQRPRQVHQHLLLGSAPTTTAPSCATPAATWWRRCRAATASTATSPSSAPSTTRGRTSSTASTRPAGWTSPTPATS
ncbi:hypothetical protein STANM309S_03686 [Streptomyces tanashiensis]